MKSTRRSRVCLWAGGTVFLALAAVWALSFLWALSTWNSRGAHVRMSQGVVAIEWPASLTEAGPAYLTNGVSVEWRAGRTYPASGWEVQRVSPGLKPRWLPSYERGRYLTPISPEGWAESPSRIVIPLWPLLLLALSVFALGVYSRRTPHPGYCQACGYDLTGNVSGLCPECGERI